MEKADHELLLRLAQTNPRIKQLYEQHQELEKEVQKFERYAAYSSSAALRQKQLKKEKLRGMDCIMAILSEHRMADHATVPS